MNEMTSQSLRDAWSTVLDLDVGPATDFFVSGGDSLAIAELQALLKDEFGIPFRNSDLLQNSTLQSFYDNVVKPWA
ncbi:acyl carrier protein [Jatrophihabitans lederbergiae]|uniref:Acyl carrier protein n=1 Tax=Jatrophihabitans lederbergiae TaxID=3075547 RepID=A0ABU2JHD9_9ACTN|nr:acyl carrier protein [Jatrophihabitans sp. DSM 44399]MDT0263914.1 acyl carrier protein [Jatrophihabitans sp. DSM 44399]